MFVYLFIAWNSRSGKLMVLSKMQKPQIGPKAVEHLQGTKGPDFASEEIQAKRNFQEGKERIFDSLPSKSWSVSIRDWQEANWGLQVRNRRGSLHRAKGGGLTVGSDEYKLSASLWIVCNQQPFWRAGRGTLHSICEKRWWMVRIWWQSGGKYEKERDCEFKCLHIILRAKVMNWEWYGGKAMIRIWLTYNL